MNLKSKLLILFFLGLFFSEKNTAQNQFKVLLYTVHDNWHSNSIPTAIEAFKKLSIKHQFEYKSTQNVDEMIEILPKYDVLVFLNANADSLKLKHINGLKKFMNRGGGFVGIHATSAGKTRQPWFDNLIGGVFVNHPKLQTAIINVEDANFPSTFQIPKKWLWTDEWYNFDNIDLKKINVVLSVDESSYDFTLGYNKIPFKSMGKLHPVAWNHKYDGGKVFYTSLGHKPEAFENDDYMNHIFGGIYWVLERKEN